MKILVTGIHSALGNALADGLREQDVIGLARREHPRYPTILCDLRQGVPSLPSVDVCLHLAFLTDPRRCREQPEEAYQVNVLGTKKLLSCARRFVLFSTGSVYGFQEGRSDEMRKPEPADDYARLKYEAEQIVLDHPRPTVLRCFWPYGPATRLDNVVNRLLDRIRIGAEVELHQEGRPRLSPTYISDLVHATRLFCLGEHDGIYNIAGNEVVSIAELAGLIGRLVGRSPVFRSTGKVVQDIAGSTTKLASLFTATVDLATGLRCALDSLPKRDYAGRLPGDICSSVRRAAG